ncbi:MAG: fluoride efflux transporter CrcB [Thermoguttaceae bacterium]
MLGVICVAIAGALGTLARYGIGVGSVALFGKAFPIGTFTVNIIGSLLFGFFAYCFGAERLPQEFRVPILTGFLGGFTTFSAFAYDNQQFFERGEWGFLALNMFGQNVFGMVAVFLGIYAATWFLPK